MLQVSEEEDTPITTRNEEEIKILFFFSQLSLTYIYMSFLCTSLLF